jgi:hypothetical protein
MMALGTIPFSISFQRGVLRPNEFFRRIRDCALDILCGAYRRPSNLSERFKIVGALDGSVPHIAPSFQVSVETPAWLEPDRIRTTRFLYEVTIPGAELPVVDAVAKWLWQARRFSTYQDDELERLQQLREHRIYQPYGILIVWHRSAEDDNPTNWRAVGQRRQQAVERYLEGLSPATMERAIRDLKIIAEQVRDESILRCIAIALTWLADTPV